MLVPGSAGARLEAHQRRPDLRRSFRVEQRSDRRRAGEPFGRAAGGLASLRCG